MSDPINYRMREQVEAGVRTLWFLTVNGGVFFFFHTCIALIYVIWVHPITGCPLSYSAFVALLAASQRGGCSHTKSW